MSVLFVCDACSEAIGPDSGGTQPKHLASLPQPAGGTIAVEVQLTRRIGAYPWNGGHICGGCLADALEDFARELRKSPAVSS